jgi:hypothetical protein
MLNGKNKYWEESQGTIPIQYCAVCIKAVIRIRIGFSMNRVPAFPLDPDPDPGSQSIRFHADPENFNFHEEFAFE